MNWRDILFADVAGLLRGDKLPARKGGRIGISPKWRGPVRGTISKNLKELIEVTGQLSTLTAANVDLVGGLDAAAMDAKRSILPNILRPLLWLLLWPLAGYFGRGSRLRNILCALAGDIEQGCSLSESMSRRNRFFPRFYIDLVKVGEDTGSLSKVLENLNKYLTEAASIYSSAHHWLTYVMASLIVQLVIAAVLVLKVFPVFGSIFGDFHDTVPEESSAYYDRLYYVSDLFLYNWWLILILISFAVILCFSFIRLLNRRGITDMLFGLALSRIPFLRSFVVKRDLSHIALILEQLLGSNMPVNEALEIASELDLNPIYVNMLKRLAERTDEGETLTAALEKEPAHLLPGSFRGMVAIGESSERLPEAFGRVGHFYRQQVLKSYRLLNTFLSPLELAVPAALVLFICTSFFGMYIGMISMLLDDL